MSTIEFGLMLQPFPVNCLGRELFEYNRGLIRRVAGGFTTLWVEEHLQLGETATHEWFVGYMNRFMPLWRYFREELNREPLGHEEWGYWRGSEV